MGRTALAPQDQVCLRRLDYWAIGVSTAFLQRELNPKLSKWVTGVSLAITPFRPFIVSAGNTAALEVSLRADPQQSASEVLRDLLHGCLSSCDRRLPVRDHAKSRQDVHQHVWDAWGPSVPLMTRQMC